MTYHAKMIAGGKIVVPAEVRRALGVKDGDSIVIERDERGQFILKTYAQVVKEVQAKFKAMVGPYEGSLVDEFIADKRREAEEEDRRTQEWLAEYHKTK
ncbi:MULTISPECIES: AbrB/MazE/SpoVT family DNA-binding domain-containing protein [unclassified Sphingomonas]|uniref:AbrB/MazE/SpoVT family DNA-binding domain-containing protein n=1 Tax=unclassified Sphingomonas TaxID=196159 RepID=UPI0008348857|nr:MULTISPECIES: AbrB/MazE/SpoVT family DNA-binding domain-containing protein [unclassified Sphingomonas]